jgi:hypothetical protein
MITVDLNNGVIKNDDENMADSTAAAIPKTTSVLRHLKRNIATLNESVVLFVELFNIGPSSGF